MIQLARGLQARGHEVKVALYAGDTRGARALREAGIQATAVSPASKLGKLHAVRRWVGAVRPDIVHGVMKRASSVAILANLPRRHARVVATDMSTASYGRHKPVLWGALALYALADAVVTQTEMNRRNLARLAPWLARRLRVIRNGVDTERFRPALGPRPEGPFRFVCVGTVYKVKNPVRIVHAVDILRRGGAPPFRLDWYGRFGQNGDSPSPDCLHATALVAALGLQDVVAFHGPRAGVEVVYREADALLHVSVQEGIPNAVVEGMACGLPVVVGTVSDLPLIVGEAENGYVCDQTDPVAIAEAMEAMLRTPPNERAAMGAHSRDLAIRWFGMDRFVDEFAGLYRQLLQR